jgi:multiple antibiotic resistance protein
MAYLDLVEKIDKRKRRFIIVREMLFALIIMVFFHYAGEVLLELLEVNEQTILLAGGLILFLIAIRMVFPPTKAQHLVSEKDEPFIFPIATPMIAGPSIVTTIMLYAYQEKDNYIVLGSLLIAWILSISVLFFAEQIKNIVGKRALIAVERLMGLLLTMMAVEKLLQGIKSLMLEGIK